MTKYKLTRPPEDTPERYGTDTEHAMDATVYAHYFIGDCDWFVVEWEREDDLVYGWACVGDRQNAELGWASLAELESVRVRNIFHVEYDEHWERVSLREAIDALDKRRGWTDLR